jgi:hypothetical protein
MAKGFVLDAASARAIDDMFTRVYGPAASQIQKRTGSPWRGNMVVRLTEEADPITEDADTIPYKATLVYLDSTNGNYVDIDFVFDPDKNTEDPGVAAYVYESNGKTGLVGKFVIITFRGAPGTGGSWVFDHSEAEPELARIQSEPYPGTYIAAQLDDDLVANGNLYDGNDLPQLQCLTGREKIEAGEVIEVLRRGEKAYFEWNDPAMRNAGDDGSPPDGGNGSFDPFAEDGGAVGGILKNFNPDDGHYLFNRLWAKGSEGSGSEATLGLAIKPVSAYNWELSIVGEDGNPYIPPPVDPEDEVTCEYSMFFNRASRELVLIQTTDDLVEHECARVHIPCCDENGEEGYDPDTPPEDPDSPTDDPYDDGCTEPTISLTPYEGICSPPAIAQKIADINIQLNGNNFRDVTIDVSANATFKGAAINNPFAVSANKKYIAWVGGAGVNGDVGDYSFEIIVSVAGCTSNWSTAYVVTIKDCDSECDEPEEVTGGDGGGGTCDESTAVVVISDTGTIPVVNTEPAERAVVTVTMNLDHGPSTLSGGSDLPAFGERTGERESSIFRYNSTLSYTMLVPDSTDTKREEIKVNPTRNVSVNAPRSTGPNQGTMKISYIGGSLKQASCRYVHNSWTYAPNGEATDGSPISSGQQYHNRSSVANGLISLSVDLITSATDPSPDRLVGRLSVDNPCTEHIYSYAINGGAEAANFVIVGDSLYLKPTADSSLIGIGTWEVTIDASHSTAPTVSKTFNLSAQAEADAIAVDNDIARGGQNEAIASITPLNGSTPVAGPMDYQAISYREGTITDQQLFYIESEANGDATLRANVNLPAGSYQVRVAAQNQTMNAGGTFVQQDIGIIIDKGAGQYIKPQLIGVV